MNDSHDLRQDLAFARWWDDLLAGLRRHPPRDLDADLTEFAQRLIDASPPVSAAPALRQRLWEELAATHLAPSNPAPFVLSTQGSDRKADLPIKIRGSAVVWYAAAALLVAVVAIAYVAFRGDESPQRNTIPAAIVSETPTPTAIPGVSELRLVDFVIPADAVPVQAAGGGFSHWAMAPGTQTTITGLSIVNVPYVLSGQLTARVGGESQLHRSGTTTWEVIPANTTVTLTSGDSMLFLGVSDIEVANSGTTPVEVLSLLVSPESASFAPPAYVSDWTVRDYELAPHNGIALPGSAVRLLIRRVELAPEAALPLADGTIVRLSLTLPWNDSGTPVPPPLVVMTEDGTMNNFGSGDATVYVASMVLEEPSEP